MPPRELPRRDGEQRAAVQSDGRPVRHSELSATKNIVHVLLDFQLWQWTGIKKGGVQIRGVTLTTVDLSPKVFDLEHYFTQEEADKIIEIGSPSLTKPRVLSKGPEGSERVVSRGRTIHTTWASWAAERLREISPEKEVPVNCQEGAELFPVAEFNLLFPHALLNLFIASAVENNVFSSRFEDTWADWITDNLATNATDITTKFIGTEARPQYIPLIVKA
jgi:hypothetical protein